MQLNRKLLGKYLAGVALCAMAATGAATAQEAFDLDALIAAAKAGPPLTVYDSTGKIVDMAEAFTAKYGVQATGSKVKATAQLEMIIREAEAKNVQGDVSILSDVPSVMAQLMPRGFATSWVPPDLADKIPAQFQNPLVVVNSANVWAYNTEAFKTCPVTNIWQLTEPEWKGRVAMQDPLGKPSYTDWFNQMQTYGDAKIAAAYKAQYGKDLDTSAETATAAWVKALASNAPLLTDADAGASQAVGAPDQKEPFMGLMSSAKFRDNAEAGYKLGLCTGLDPWIGFANSGVGVIMAGTDSPNAAKLFIHYVMTAEGIAPQAEDGKMSTNNDVSLPDDEPSGIGAVIGQVFPYEVSSALADFDARQDWQDFWRINYSK